MCPNSIFSQFVLQSENNHTEFHASNLARTRTRTRKNISKQGKLANQIQRELKHESVGIRRQRLLYTIRTIKGKQLKLSAR